MGVLGVWVYLDYNVIMFLGDVVWVVMILVMDIVGNLLLVYSEGCVVKGLMEKVCQDIVEVMGVGNVDIVFVFGVIEVVVLVCVGCGLLGVEVEYEVVLNWLIFDLVVDV